MGESIWKQLNRDFSLSSVGQAFRSVASNSSNQSSRNLVDRVLETAREEALQRGVGVEVLGQGVAGLIAQPRADGRCVP